MKKVKKIRPRNVMMLALRQDARYHQRAAKSQEEKDIRDDKWHRKGKYKTNIIEEY